MLILKLSKQYTKNWLSLQFKNWTAMIIFKGYEFKDINIRDVIALNIDGFIYCIGNLQAFYRIRNTKYFRIYVQNLMSFEPIKYQVEKEYEISDIIVNKKDSWIKIGENERKIHRFHSKFVANR